MDLSQHDYMLLVVLMYSEASSIGPPLGPIISGPINEVALLMKTSLIRP